MIIIEINAAGSGDVPRTEIEGAVAGSPGSDGKKARAIEAACRREYRASAYESGFATGLARGNVKKCFVRELQKLPVVVAS